MEAKLHAANERTVSGRNADSLVGCRAISGNRLSGQHHGTKCHEQRLVKFSGNVRSICARKLRRDWLAQFFAGKSCADSIAKGMRATHLLSLTVFLFAATSFGQSSPEVHADGRVTFRLKAADAKDVRLRCEGIKDTKLEKDDKGNWTFTSEPLEADIYAYSFQVDGARVIDPANPSLKYNLLNTVSQVHVPGPASLPWEVNDVPHGQLHRHYFKSAVTGDQRDFLVYTPPDYDPTSHRHYPTLYLLHGFSDDATGWISAGFANVILDNLIARKQAKPMIVIMPLGYGKMDYVFAAEDRRREDRQRNIDQFRETLFNEVMPMAEKAYRLSPDRKHRAIAGLSMGGGESLFIGLNGLDRFAWIG